MSCKDKSTNTVNTKNPSLSYQLSKCIHEASYSSYSLAKGLKTASDSIFSYSFSQNLILDFSVTANCCPDSNRFTVGQEIRNDTIIITVLDIAKDGCYCDCVYMVHTEITDLPNYHYTVRCRDGHGQSFHDPLHLVNVVRYFW